MTDFKKLLLAIEMTGYSQSWLPEEERLCKQNYIYPRFESKTDMPKLPHLLGEFRWDMIEVKFTSSCHDLRTNNGNSSENTKSIFFVARWYICSAGIAIKII